MIWASCMHACRYSRKEHVCGCCYYPLRLWNPNTHAQRKQVPGEIALRLMKCKEISVSIDSAAPTWQLQAISKLRCYCGAITGKQAEKKLREHKKDCYLIRYSEVRGFYVLTVAVRGKEGEEMITKHFKLNIAAKADPLSCLYEIEGTKKKFDNISKLLEFYENNALSYTLSSIGSAFTVPGSS